jgi:uncharacterized protein (DUF58 family)
LSPSTPPAGDRTGLTARGVAVALGSVLFTVAGALVGIVELYALAAAGAALVLAGTAWVALRTCSLDVRRELHPPRLEAGRTLRVELVVANRQRRRSPAVTLRDGLDDGRLCAVLAVAPLDPGRSERGGYPTVATTRGRLEVGPLVVELTDPFSLARRRRTAVGVSTVYVHPRVERLRALPPSAHEDRRAGAGALAPASAGDEFFALRPYRDGDDLRRVHWAATARSDDLIIRQDQSSYRSRLTVVVDLRASAWSAASEGLETALSAAASVAAAAQAEGLEVRLVTSTPVDTGWQPPERSELLLDTLAAATAHEGPGRPMTAAGGDGDSVVVIGSDLLDAAAVVGRRPAGSGPVTVVRVGGGRPAPGCVQLLAGRPIAPAWDATASRPGDLRPDA